jgi:hypothetical protein
MRNKLIAALAVAAIPLTAQAAAPTVAVVQGNGAFVSFSHVSDDGCVFTSGQLAVVQSHAGDDKEGVLAVATRFNNCDGTFGAGYFGSGDLSYSVNGLSSASAQGAVVLTTWNGDADIIIDLDLTWTGTGAVSKGGFRTHDEYVLDFNWQQGRAATTVGTFDIDGEAADLDGAMLAQGVAGSVYH